MPVIILTGIYCTNLILHDDEKDPSHIVIDEFAGLWLSLLIIPVTILNAILGFIFFRFFDIAKPFGIRKMERLKKGKGIMADDLLAGLYSNILLQLILFLKVC
jgi:phosphatidylglycerophosphatase A